MLNSHYFRWRNWIIRGIFTWVMICGFGTVILLGPLYIVLLVCLLWEKLYGSYLCLVVTYPVLCARMAGKLYAYTHLPSNDVFENVVFYFG